jgi:hypothetical protein
MTPLYRVLGAILAIALMAVIVWASSAALTVHGSTDGLLRLAWSARPERIEKCRQRTEEELTRLPQHMRQPLACEGTTAEYRLQVRIDGALAAERLVRGGGLRRDRRLYVYDEVPLRAGVDSTIAVRLDRVDPAAPGPGSARPDREAVARSTASVPPNLSLERRVRVSPRQVVLIVYDPDRRELRAVTP